MPLMSIKVHMDIEFKGGVLRPYSPPARGDSPFERAFVMGWPGKEATIPALAVGGKNSVPRIRDIELLGHKGKLKWTQDAGNLKIELPEEKPSDHAVTFKIALA